MASPDSRSGAPPSPSFTSAHSPRRPIGTGSPVVKPDETEDSPAEASSGNDNADIPMTMAASVVLDALPRDAHRALESAGELRDAKGEVRKKVKIRLSPLAATPALRQPVFLCGAAQKFSFIVSFLRSRLKVPPHAGVHCYVNSVFAPAMDEGVGNLWKCFKTGDELVVSYSLAQAFG